MVTTHPAPSPTIRDLLPAGWHVSHVGWAWFTQCPRCGRDITEPALSFLVDHCADHARHCTA